MEKALLFRDYSFRNVIDFFSEVLVNKHLSSRASIVLFLTITIVGAIICCVNIVKSRNITKKSGTKEMKEKKYHLANIIAMSCFMYAFIVNSIMLYKENCIDITYLYDILPVANAAFIPYLIFASKEADLKETILEALKHYLITFAKFVVETMIFMLLVMLIWLLKL